MVFFFYGPNRYAMKQQIHQLRAAFIAKSGSDFGVEQIDGAALDPRRLPELLLAAPFLANTRLVIFENLGKNKAATEKALELLDTVPESTVAVFAEPEADQRTTWFKTLIKKGKVAQFELLEGAPLLSWIRRAVEEQGGTIDRSAASALVAACGSDQWRLAQEIQKLVSYQTEVTEETVRLLVETTVEQSIFALVEAMTGGKTAATLEIYRELIRQRVNEFYILTMVQWQLRNLLIAKAGDTIASSELAKTMKVSPYVMSKAQQASRRLDIAQLEAGFLASLDTEVDMKSGRPQAEALEQLLYRLATSFSMPPVA